MVIRIFCIMCDKELEEKGAILLSPPENDKTTISQVNKYHVCKKCYTELWRLIIKWKRKLKK